MDARKAVTIAGVLAGAAIGATTLYVALKPGLRKKVRKADTARQALTLIGHEMGSEAREVAHDMTSFMKHELTQRGRVPSRWLRRRAKALKAAEKQAEALAAA